MKTPPSIRSAVAAWAASLPLALTMPAMVWMVVWAVSGELIRNFSVCLLVVAAALVVHLLSYLVTGLPIFLCKFKNPQSLIWKLQVAFPAGVLLGCAVVLGFMLFQSGSVFETPEMYLVCGGYGLATAIAAWLQRPKLQTP
jgi:energy-converting hydrogenase Eha subunit A